eukprot:TRINITY_DN6384_c0_g1_i1.p1 TRINITY_DN6384_c0_g1~~TRINITY_DN6384_c0_g1_i1.p1  ORF type:complete len:315 (-),score=72.84 TRINITY_DN6384_c0_g1_i1:417-1325(-)
MATLMSAITLPTHGPVSVADVSKNVLRSSITGNKVVSRGRSHGFSMRRCNLSLSAKVWSQSERPAIVEENTGLSGKLASGFSALALSAALQLSPVAPEIAWAGEANIINSSAPAESHFYDDAGVLSRVTKSDLKNLLGDLESKTGYHIDIVTIRKLTAKSDAFEFADSVLESWYPTVELGDKKGVVVLVTTAKEGAVSGGPSFNDAVGDKVLEAVVADNLPVLATEEKYNEAAYSTAKRLAAAIQGLPDIDGPKFQEAKRESNFRSKEETEDKRGVFITTVGGLLVIAFVVPMLQYFAYTRK